MRPMWWMIGGGLASWAAVAVMPGFDNDREVLLGLLGPMAGAVLTWILVARTYASRPERLTGLMLAAFGGKLVFFAAYVVVMLKVLALRPLPFVASFTAYFIGLHICEALCMQRLFAGQTPTTR